MILKQEFGKTLPEVCPAAMLAEKILFMCAVADMHAGHGHISQGTYLEAERLFIEAEPEVPLCCRTSVGSVRNGRRGCCVGLTMTQRRQATSQPVVASKTASIRSLTQHLNGIFRQAFPDLIFTSLQIGYNGRAVMHTDTANCGLSAILTVGSFSGGSLFTMREDGTPVLIDSASQPMLFNGNIPHATLPFDGYRLVAIAFLHKSIFQIAEWQRQQLTMLGFKLPPQWFSTCDFPRCQLPTMRQACLLYEDFCMTVAESVEQPITAQDLCDQDLGGWDGSVETDGEAHRQRIELQDAWVITEKAVPPATPPGCSNNRLNAIRNTGVSLLRPWKRWFYMLAGSAVMMAASSGTHASLPPVNAAEVKVPSGQADHPDGMHFDEVSRRERACRFEGRVGDSSELLCADWSPAGTVEGSRTGCVSLTPPHRQGHARINELQPETSTTSS